MPAALRGLIDDGRKLAVVTNSGAQAGRRTLDAAGLAECFDRILGVDTVEAFKPHPDVYAHATREIGSEITYVASHAWDLAGAARAGFQTALVTRGQPRQQLFAEPSLVAADMAELALGLS